MANLIDKVKVKPGRLIRVYNTEKKKNENDGYVSVWVEDANGKNERCLLFTEKEIERAESRSKKNIEDQPNKNFLTDLLD
jgi:hypothetical protein